MFVEFLLIVVMRLGRVVVVQCVLKPSCAYLIQGVNAFFNGVEIVRKWLDGHEMRIATTTYHFLQELGQRIQTNMFDGCDRITSWSYSLEREIS